MVFIFTTYYPKKTKGKFYQKKGVISAKNEEQAKIQLSIDPITKGFAKIELRLVSGMHIISIS